MVNGFILFSINEGVIKIISNGMKYDKTNFFNMNYKIKYSLKEANIVNIIIIKNLFKNNLSNNQAFIIIFLFQIWN